MGFNFLDTPHLPAPKVSQTQAGSLLSLYWGLTATAKPLGSNQDSNFLVYDGERRIAGVLKIANPAFTDSELAAQDAAASAIAAAEPSLRVAVPLPNLAGETSTLVPDLLDDTAHVRLLRHLSGGTLNEVGYLSPSVVAAMGELAGRVSRALAGFRHPGLERTLQWNPLHAHDIIHTLVPHVSDPAMRERLITTTDDAWSRLAAVAHHLPRQAAHLDLTDANIVSGSSTHLPDGIIDFGDLSTTWAVSELAITLSSVLGHPGADPTSIVPGIHTFHAMRSLSTAEVDALWPLLVLRTAVLIVSGAHQATFDPDNEYLTNQSAAEHRMFEMATSVPMDVMSSLIRAQLQMTTTTDDLHGVLIEGINPATVHTLDLSTESEVFDGATDHFAGPHFESELAEAAIAGGAALVVTPFGEAQLTRAPLLSQDSPPVVATGVSLWPAHALTVCAPWSGDIIGDDGHFTLRGAEYELTLSAPAAPGHVDEGATIASVAASTWTTLHIRPVGAPVAPAFTTAELAPGWLAHSRDPRPLLGLPDLPHTATPNLLRRSR